MDDYKNSKEGRIVAAKYADILHKSRPEPSFKHPRMSLSNRAKIFSPFAALRGYEEEIEDEKWKQTRVTKKILSDEEAAELSDRLLQVKKGMIVTVRYFKADTEHPAMPPLGTYETIAGKVETIDPAYRKIAISTGNTKVPICGYTGALKAPVRCFGNHLSGKRKSWFRTDNECGGAAILKTRTSRMGTPVGC